MAKTAAFERIKDSRGDDAMPVRQSSPPAPSHGERCALVDSSRAGTRKKRRIHLQRGEKAKGRPQRFAVNRGMSTDSVFAPICLTEKWYKEKPQ
jgi:hypothetical protein